MFKKYALPILLLTFFGWMFTACENGLTNSSPDLSDDELISAIQSAEKMSVSVETLPSGVQNEVQSRRNQAIASGAFEANGLGFEVEMRTVNRGAVGEASTIYFNAKGRVLKDNNGVEKGNGNSKGKGNTSRRDGGNNAAGNGVRPFELVMPYQVTMPDDTIIDITSEDDYALIRTWYQENPGTRERFSLVFPVTVLIDGEEVSMDQDAFEELIQSQKGDRGPKVYIQMPYQVTMPDGSAITIETKEDRALIRTWYEENPGVEEKFTFVFPLTVVIGDQEVVVNSEEELQVLRRRYVNSIDNRGHKACYDIQFPHTLIMPDGSTITLSERGDFSLVRAWFAENVDYRGQRPTHQFPITLLVKDEAGEQTEVVINSQEEFDAYREANCSRSANDDDDSDDESGS
jgi:hypothetical protein